ncbi:hypothetical protein [Mesobacillus zeae]
MEEMVVRCDTCGKTIYCLDGFLNGVHTDSGSLQCFQCYEADTKKEN